MLIGFQLVRWLFCGWIVAGLESISWCVCVIVGCMLDWCVCVFVGCTWCRGLQLLLCWMVVMCFGDVIGMTNLSLPFCLEVPCLPCSSLDLDALKSCSWSDREMSWSWWFSELTQAGRSSWHQVRWCQLVSSPGTYPSQPWLWGQCDLFSMWIAFSSKVALKPDYTKMSFFPLLFDFITIATLRLLNVFCPDAILHRKSFCNRTKF